MALVNPNIAMSFRQPEFQPRNALAEYAQVQQIVGGQRQAEMADMQMDVLRRKERAISQIQATAAKNGGPTDRREIARAYINSGVPEFMQFGLTMDKDLDELDAFSRIMGGGAGGAARAAPSAAATAGANAMAAPAMPAPAAVAGSQAQGAGASVADSQATLKQIPPRGTKDIFAGQLSEEEKQRIASDPHLKDFYEIFSQNAASFLNRPTNSHFYQQNVHRIAEQAKRLNDLGIKVPGTLEEIRQALGVRFPDPPDIVAPEDFAGGRKMLNEIRRDYGEAAARSFDENGYLYTKNFPRLTPAAPTAQPPATANALAPAVAAAPVTNAMVAPAAQPAVPPAGVNQLASAGAAPAGAAPAGTAPADPVAALLAKRDQLLALGTPRALQAAKSLDADIARVSKTTAVTPGSTVIGPDGRVIYTAPAAPTAPKIDVIGVAKGTETPVFFDARTDEQFTLVTDAAGKQTRKPYTGGVNRSTSTVTATATSSTPTAKSLSAEVGDRARTSLTKAEGAAGIMESANMVREALNTGNVIAGPLAGIRTKFAQVLELAGAGDKEKLVATRTAIQGLATLTLESRAELRGQGQVTVDEQKLLERARSGNVEDMTIAELQQVVNVSQRLANRMWSSHQTLLKTMEGDPAAADTIRYYRPTMPLSQAIGEGRPQAETDKRKQRLEKILDSQQQQQQQQQQR